MTTMMQRSRTKLRR